MKIFLTGASGFIGTNTVESLMAKGHEVRNFDISEPLNALHRPLWRPGSILDAHAVDAEVGNFGPDAVIHLAARTDCVENVTVEEGYRVNTEGTRNVLEAIRNNPTVKRAIITSSQFVCGPGYTPEHDEDYRPATVYGQSKVITEKLTRSFKLPCTWTLVRPTNIWGPWHPRYAKEFWRIAAKGLYVHPGGKGVIRCYGYVGNLVYCLLRILEAEESVVDEKTFYLGEPPADIYGWANAFTVGLCGRRAPRVPRGLLRLMGLAGDMISKVSGKQFYITSSRYQSMVTDYYVPGKIEDTIAALGAPPFTLEEGVAKTLAWLKTQPGY